MTVWNDEKHSRHLSKATWMANTAVLMHLNARATGDPARDWLSSWAHRWFVGPAPLRVLVLGCGEGWLERALARWPFVGTIDAVDFADEAVARARKTAQDEGLPNIRYGVADLNRATLEPAAYDVVVAHSVLHHVEALEHAYEQIDRAMRPDATLIINEYVGPNRFQYSDRVDDVVNTLLRALPQRLRQPYETRPRPTVEEMIANDPTEAVRSADVLPVAAERFEILEQKAIGGTILQYLLYDIVQNFRFDDPRERALIEMLCTIEAMLVDSQVIPCDFVIAAARKKGSRVTKSDRPPGPRAEGAEQVEGDPLRTLPFRRPEGSRRALDARGRSGSWQVPLRLLRLAFLAQQPSRANLWRERAFCEWRERLLAGRSDPWSWLLARAPDDVEIRPLLEAAATLAPA